HAGPGPGDRRSRRCPPPCGRRARRSAVRTPRPRGPGRWCRPDPRTFARTSPNRDSSVTIRSGYRPGASGCNPDVRVASYVVIRPWPGVDDPRKGRCAGAYGANPHERLGMRRLLAIGATIGLLAGGAALAADAYADPMRDKPGYST